MSALLLRINRRRTHLFAFLTAAVLAVAILYPVYHAVRRAFSVDGALGLANVRAFLDAPGLGDMLVDTLILTAGGTTVAMVIGTILAITTTVLPSGRRSRRILQLAPLIPLTLPALVGAIGWLFLLEPRVGWLNIFLRWLTNDDTGRGPISAYSRPVAVWVIGLYVVPFVYTIMASSLSRLNTELLEGYQINGASAWGAMMRAIVGPLRPAFFAALSLAVMDAVAQFSIPLILSQDVITTYMYQQISFSGNYGAAAAAGLPLFILAAVLTFVQIRLAARSARYTTVTGRGTGVRGLSFGRVTDACFKGFAYLYMLVAGVLPFCAILLVSFLKFWRPRLTWDSFTTVHYPGVWTNPISHAGVVNSFQLGVVCTIIALTIALVVVVLVERVGGWSSRAAYFFANLPFGIPHVLLGLAFLVAFISPPIVLYGTIWLLVLAFGVAYLPIAVRNIGPLFQQIGRELEEAALVSGATRPRMMSQVTLPLVMPGVAASGALLFMLIFREFPIAAFTSTPSTNVLSVVLVGYNTEGAWPKVAVVAVFLSVVSLIGIIAANIITARFDLARRTSRKGPPQDDAPAVSASRPELADANV
jgi:iron(III) transport system permease protein